MSAYDFPELPYAGTSGHSGGDTSRERALRDDHDGTTSKRQQAALRHLRDAGHGGLTWKELADLIHGHHGQASGVLSVLHMTGHIARLTQRRNRCSVYVLPEHVDGRDTIEHAGRKQRLTVCPHCGGDL